MSKIVLGLDLGLVIGGSFGYFVGKEIGCIPGLLIGGALGTYLATRQESQIEPQDFQFAIDVLKKIGMYGFIYLSFYLHFKNFCAFNQGFSCHAAPVAHGIFLLIMGTALLNTCYNIGRNWRALSNS